MASKLQLRNSLSSSQNLNSILFPSFLHEPRVPKHFSKRTALVAWRCGRKNGTRSTPQRAKDRTKDRNAFKRYEKSSSTTMPPSIDVGKVLEDGSAIGRVVSAQANFLKVLVVKQATEGLSIDLNAMVDTFSECAEDGPGTVLLCVVRSVLKKLRRRVYVGDYVVVTGIDWVNERGMVEHILPRTSQIQDPPIANVNHILLLFSLARPTIEPSNLTRFLVSAESTGIKFTVAFNKTDLLPQEEVEKWENRVQQWGYTPWSCSVELGLGVTSLEAEMRGKVTVLAGPSGVGKSSLINALQGSLFKSEPEDSHGYSLLAEEPTTCLESENEGHPLADSAVRVGPVSERTGRGKHTTRHVELLRLPSGGLLADSPGFSQPSLSTVSSTELPLLFPEIRAYLASSHEGCSFADCLHLGEPGCVVDHEWERYGLYKALLEEVKAREVLQKKAMGTKREGDVRMKTGTHGLMSAEPRLDFRKHRRLSRKSVNQKLHQDYDDEEEENVKLDLDSGLALDL